MEDGDLEIEKYAWANPQKKRIKYYVFSSPFFYRNKSPKFHKKLVEYPDTGCMEDIDVFNMKHKYILPRIQQDSDAEFRTNLTRVKLLERIDALNADFTLQNFECFFFMFFTFSSDEINKRGEKDVEEEMLHFQDGKISINDIWERLTGIEGLRGKPKVFLIQSDNYKLIYPDQKVKAGPVSFDKVKMPLDADRLIIQSTIPAYFAQHTDSKQGKGDPSSSYLVQAFLKIMDENERRPVDDQCDMLSLTTAINGQIERLINEVKGKVNFEDRLPFSQISSTLTKLLYL